MNENVQGTKTIELSHSNICTNILKFELMLAKNR